MGRVTIQDVAADAGVSRSTVSLVIRDSDRIPSQTRDRVLASMRKLNYVYDQRAANLRTGKTPVVGLVMSDVRSHYHAELSAAIESALQAHDLTMILGYTHDDVRRQGRLLTTMVQQRVGGVILMSAPAATRPLDDLVRAGIPCVTLGRRIPGAAVDHVSTDNVAAGRMLGEHLRTLGVANVALVGGSEHTSPFQERKLGLSQGLGLGGEVRGVPTQGSVEAGRDGAEQVLTQWPAVQALVAYTDTIALGVYHAVSGLPAPVLARIALASFDDSPEASLLSPPLSSVSTDPQLVGAETVRLLIGRQDDPAGPAREVLLRPRTHWRASTLGRIRGGPDSVASESPARA